MNDRAAVLFEAYDFELQDIRKGRGMLIAQTKEGLIALKEYTGNEPKAEWQEAFTKQLKKAGYEKAESLFRDKEDNLIQTDYEGTTYLVKEYIKGKECATSDKMQCINACKEMARFHLAARKAMKEPLYILHKQVLPRIEPSEDGGKTVEPEPYELQTIPASDRKYDMMTRKSEGFIAYEYEKRIGEMNRARQFIRKNRSKNDFDLLFLKEFERFLDQAKQTSLFLTDKEQTQLEKQVLTEKQYCHGDLNHHNILFVGSDCYIQNLEKMRMDLQVKDLYLFVRKICEKNHYSFAIGKTCIDAYQQENMLSLQEHKYLYASFLFPEKFCKIANGYMSQKKALPPKRQWDKLTSLLQMEPEKAEFLRKYRECYLA